MTRTVRWLEKHTILALQMLMEAADGNEICGFIRRSVLGGMEGEWVIHPMENVSITPSNQFKMDDHELVEFYRRHIDHVVGIYHSHPAGTTKPSSRDLYYAPDGMRYWIITQDGAFEWEMSGDKPVAVPGPQE